MNPWLSFFIGLLAGGSFGGAAMCLFAAAGAEERRESETEPKP